MTSQRVKGKYEWIITNVTREELMKEYFAIYFKKINLRLGDKNSAWIVHLTRREKEGEQYLSILLTSDIIEKIPDIEVKFSFSLGDLHAQSIRRPLFLLYSWGFLYAVSFNKLFDGSFRYVDANGWMKLNFEIELSTLLPLVSRSFNYAPHLTDPKYSDFIIQSSDEKEFKVHRVILAGISPFFETLFDVDMQEKKNKKVIFNDINSVTLKEVLRYVYTGKATANGVQMAIDLLDASEKFLIKELKPHCIAALMKHIKIENVLKIFITADLYKDENLERACMDLILSHYTELRSSEEWKELLSPSHVLKIADALAEEANIETIVVTSNI